MGTNTEQLPQRSFHTRTHLQRSGNNPPVLLQLAAVCKHELLPVHVHHTAACRFQDGNACSVVPHILLVMTLSDHNHSIGSMRILPHIDGSNADDRRDVLAHAVNLQHGIGQVQFTHNFTIRCRVIHFLTRANGSKEGMERRALQLL